MKVNFSYVNVSINYPINTGIFPYPQLNQTAIDNVNLNNPFLNGLTNGLLGGLIGGITGGLLGGLASGLLGGLANGSPNSIGFPQNNNNQLNNQLLLTLLLLLLALMMQNQQNNFPIAGGPQLPSIGPSLPGLPGGFPGGLPGSSLPGFPSGSPGASPRSSIVVPGFGIVFPGSGYYLPGFPSRSSERGNQQVAQSPSQNNQTPGAQGGNQQVVQLAMQHLGKPYVWGGTGPNSFDCSGLVQYVFRQAGKELPRTADQQFNVGTPVSRDQLQPGDLVFFKDTYKNNYPNRITHVGIYIGNDRFIHAANPDQGVIISSLSESYWAQHYAGAKRV